MVRFRSNLLENMQKKPKDKKNNCYVDDETSFRNKKRIWRKLLQREKNVR